MLTMIGAVATFDCENLLERQRERIAFPKAAGKYKSRTVKAIDNDVFEEIYKDYMLRMITKADMTKKLIISMPTLNRIIKEREKRI